MEKVFRLEPKPMPKGMYIFVGVIFILNGSLMIFTNSLKPLSVILGILIILAGFGYIFLSPFKYSMGSRFFPKVQISNSSFRAKNRILGRPVEYHWKDIKEIEFDSYILRFKINKSIETFRYHSTPEISIDIKNAIREVATSKDIPVIGG